MYEQPQTEVVYQEMRQESSPQLVLYYFPSCPYCRKVLDHLEAMGKTLPKRDTRENSDFKDELKAMGGKTQVPALRIENSVLYESDAIVAYLNSIKDDLPDLP